MHHAFKVGSLAFDSTQISAADVDFPIDTIMYLKDSNYIVEHRYEKSDLQEILTWWQEHLRDGIGNLPSSWINPLYEKLPGRQP